MKKCKYCQNFEKLVDRQNKDTNFGKCKKVSKKSLKINYKKERFGI